MAADGPAGVPPSDGRPPRLAGALTGAFTTALEWAFPFVTTNAAWVVAVVFLGFLALGAPVAWLLTPLLALPTASLMRLAVAANRLGVPSVRMARDELSRLAARKVVLAAIQLLLIVIGLTNLRLAVDIGGFGGVLSAAVALYAVLGASMLAVALWPVVCDPVRQGPVRAQLRLALAVVVRRPLQVVGLAVVAGLAVLVSVQLIVPALFLPSLVLLAIAGYVVPAADELAPPSA